MEKTTRTTQGILPRNFIYTVLIIAFGFSCLNACVSKSRYNSALKELDYCEIDNLSLQERVQSLNAQQMRFNSKVRGERELNEERVQRLEAEKEKLDAEFLIGFNLVAAAGAARKAGSELAYDVNKCFLKPEQVKPSRKRVELEPIDIDTLHRLYSGWALKSRLFNVNRSKKYLYWRMQEHPFKQIQSYRVTFNGETAGYIVTDKVTEGEKTTLTINDYNPGLMNKHLTGITEPLMELNPDATVLEMDTIQGGERQRSARRLGFEVVPWYQVIMKALRGTRQESGVVYRGDVRLGYIRNWHIAESDIY